MRILITSDQTSTLRRQVIGRGAGVAKTVRLQSSVQAPASRRVILNVQPAHAESREVHRRRRGLFRERALLCGLVKSGRPGEHPPGQTPQPSTSGVARNSTDVTDCQPDRCGNTNVAVHPLLQEVSDCLDRGIDLREWERPAARTEAPKCRILPFASKEHLSLSNIRQMLREAPRGVLIEFPRSATPGLATISDGIV